MRKSRLSREDGTVIILAALMFVVAFGFAALAVDVGTLLTARTELQNAMDAAALAGATKLEVSDYDGARALATQFAALNTVLGQPVVLDPNNGVVFGCYDAETKSFTALADLPPGTIPDSMQINASANVSFFMAPVFGVNGTTIGTSSTSVASQSDKYVMLVIDKSGSMGNDSVYRTCPEDIPDTGYYGLTRPAGPPHYPQRGYTLDGTFVSVDPYSYFYRHGYYYGEWKYLTPGTLLYVEWDWHTSSWVPCSYHKQLFGIAQPMTYTQTAAENFVDMLDLNFDKVGLVSFTTSASLDSQLVQDRNTIVNAIWSFHPEYSTNTGQGLEYGVDELTSPRATGFCRKIIILLSDGMANVGGRGYNGEGYALWAADQARSNNILLYAISLGAGADRSFMQELANTAGGTEYFSADGTDLPQIFESIFERVPPQLTM